MALVDACHAAGIGVILDWVPGHFPRDPHALGLFDGTYLYEYDDPRKREHGEWSTDVFDYEKGPVLSFLISNAAYWLREYHVDGLRVDAVSSMLYLDYARRKGQWAPNRYGGHENLEAIAFLRRLNESIHAEFPGVLMIAEESTAWPGVTRSTDRGGLGFDLKWDLGWMHDTLNAYLRVPPDHRADHAQQLTIRARYMHDERYVLPLSHDEVVHGKGSLVGKMPGDDHDKFANVRLLIGHQHAQPGRPLLFMGDEFGQRREWDHDRGLDWELLEIPAHFGLRRWVRDLNAFNRSTPALPPRRRPGRLLLGRPLRDRPRRPRLLPPRPPPRRGRPLRLQLPRRAGLRPPRRRPDQRPLGRAAQQRLRLLRRRQPRQLRRRRRRADRLSGATPSRSP